MPEKSDITVTLPIEYFTALSAVISVGLQRAKIAPKTRNELLQWWEAEKAFIIDDLPKYPSE